MYFMFLLHCKYLQIDILFLNCIRNKLIVWAFSLINAFVLQQYNYFPKRKNKIQIKTIYIFLNLFSGYYQPAGPLISVPHGHSQPPPAAGKSAPLSDSSPTSSTPPLHQPPPPKSAGDSSDSEVSLIKETKHSNVFMCFTMEVANNPLRKERLLFF